MAALVIQYIKALETRMDMERADFLFIFTSLPYINKIELPNYKVGFTGKRLRLKMRFFNLIISNKKETDCSVSFLFMELEGAAKLPSLLLRLHLDLYRRLEEVAVVALLQLVPVWLSIDMNQEVENWEHYQHQPGYQFGGGEIHVIPTMQWVDYHPLYQYLMRRHQHLSYCPEHHLPN